jgi:DNA-directed RNA polymerase I subunit RPA49
MSCTLRPSAEELKEAEAAKIRPNVRFPYHNIQRDLWLTITQFAAQRKSLGMEFGTKKAKKMIASLTENKISSRARPDGAIPVDARTAAILEELAETTANLATREERQAAVDEAKPRPKPNLAATTPAEVYDLHNLVSEEDLKDMPVKVWQDAAESGEDVRTLSRYVSNRLYELSSKKENVLRLRALRFVYMLIQFHASLQSGKGGTKKLPPKANLATKVEGASEAILGGIKRNFTDGSYVSQSLHYPCANYTCSVMTKWHVEKLILHIAALTLYIDEFSTDTHDLREDLQLDNRQIGIYYSELGCKISKPTEKDRTFKISPGVSKAEASLHKMAKLKLPLEFPKQRIPKSSKGR